MRNPKPGEQIPVELLAAAIQPFIGTTQYEKLIRDYPDWFPELLEWRRKMDMVPQEVHDAHWAEHMEQYNKFNEPCPYAGMGIIWYMDHPKEFAEHNNWRDERRDEWNTLEKAIFNKHYGPYGLFKD